jgi:DNA-binding response OmpR family regulator
MRILVIDDEKIVADTLALILKKAGYDVRAAYDGAVAMELAGVFAPECIICDVILPGMDGISVCSQITAMLPQCRVFIFSGQMETGLPVEDGRAVGHEWEILVKPIMPDELLAKMAHAASQVRGT